MSMQSSRQIFVFAILSVFSGCCLPVAARAVEPGPGYQSGTNAWFGNQQVQFLLFSADADETDSTINRLIQQKLGTGRTHHANQSYWISLSQANDEQLVMAFYDKTFGKFQWLRIRWHKESTRILQVTNGTMSRWQNLSFGQQQRFNYSIGENRYVLEIRNPSADGGWDVNDVIYAFRVYDR